MSKMLIVNNCLFLGGAERLVYELAIFALKNDVKPYVLIIDNYSQEHYDTVLKGINVPVIRTRLDMISKLRHPKRIFKAFIWKLRLNFFSSEFDSIHILNLVNADKVKKIIRHKKRYYWHITNAIQYPNSKMPFTYELFSNEEDSIIFINEYQIKEIEMQYGNINCKKINFKLFIN